ncbi:MAG: sporulation protein YabP [Ruminococcus sp.]|nr:sporulation protein YabP [Ruminococcus sp.]
MSIGSAEKSGVSGRHSIVMQDCASISVTGVTDVDSFDERQVKLFTECGEMVIHGENLHVNEMSVEVGNVSVEGEISALVYGDKAAKKHRSFISKLLR